MGQRTPLGIYTNEPSENTAEFIAAKKLSFTGTTELRYLRTSSGCSWTASLNEQKMIPFSANFSLKVVFTETESITASTAIPLNILRSSRGIPSFSKVRSSSGSTSSRLLGPSFFLGAA